MNCRYPLPPLGFEVANGGAVFKREAGFREAGEAGAQAEADRITETG